MGFGRHLPLSQRDPRARGRHAGGAAADRPGRDAALQPAPRVRSARRRRDRRLHRRPAPGRRQGRPRPLPAGDRRGAPFLSSPGRPRLVLLHYTAAPVLGGVESILESHRRLLSGAGYPVRVVAGRGEAELVPELDSRHPEVEALTRRLAAGDPAPEEFRRLAAGIAGKLEPLLAETDLVIAHNVMTMPFNLPL